MDKVERSIRKEKELKTGKKKWANKKIGET
jgi:hypothetical protein